MDGLRCVACVARATVAVSIASYKGIDGKTDYSTYSTVQILDYNKGVTVLTSLLRTP